MEEEILYLDNHLLVINKKAGLVTQENEQNELSVQKNAKQWMKNRFQKFGNVFLEPIHRLDRPVTGVIVFARTGKALSRLMAHLREKNCQKEYHALVEGVPSPEEGELKHYLLHDNYFAKVMPNGEKKALLCILKYHLLQKNETSSLLQIFLETGRYHQIRAQLSAIKHPIIGDRKYGSKKPSYHPEAIYLHHYRFTIPHPISGQSLCFKAPYPSAWKNP